MIGSDSIILPFVILAAIAYAVTIGILALFGIHSSGTYAAIAALLVLVSPFVLYHHTAVYSDGPARGDYDFGFPFRWVTTQGDAGPFRFRPWALACDCACGAAVWLLVYVRRFQRVLTSSPSSSPSPPRYDY